MTYGIPTLAEEELRTLSRLIRDDETQALVDRSVLECLAERLAQADFLPHVRLPQDVVSIGSIVRVRDPEEDEDELIRLVWPNEARSLDGYLSVTSPIGASMLGSWVGETVTMRPGGYSLKIEAIPFRPRLPVVQELSDKSKTPPILANLRPKTLGTRREDFGEHLRPNAASLVSGAVLN